MEKSCMNCYHGTMPFCEVCRECIEATRNDYTKMHVNWKPKQESPKENAVEHPSHYKGKKYECIDVMQEVFGIEATKNFCLLNSFKYLWRCNKKHDDAITDVKKARFYLNTYIKLTEGAANNGREENDTGGEGS